jgi:hypothetical protein
VANSTQVITDLGSVITNGPSSATLANAINPSGLTATGGAGNLSGGTGVYGSGTYYGGIMDYNGCVKLCQLKAQEIAVLLARVLVDTDALTDQTNSALIAKVLNVFQ